MDTEETFAAFLTRMKTAYGDGAEALPWSQIIAIIMSVISGCVPTPTPAGLADSLTKLKTIVALWRAFMHHGFKAPVIDKIILSLSPVATAATIPERTSFINAASETAIAI